MMMTMTQDIIEIKITQSLRSNRHRHCPLLYTNEAIISDLDKAPKSLSIFMGEYKEMFEIGQQMGEGLH